MGKQKGRRGAPCEKLDRMRGLAHRPSSVGWIGFTKRRWLRSPPQTHAMVHFNYLQNIYDETYINYTGFPAFVKEIGKFRAAWQPL
jgi:hypothetical protein